MLLVVIPHGNLSANLASHSTTYTPAHAFTQPPKNRIYVTPFTDALLLHCTSTSTAQYSSGQRQSIPRQVCTASLVIVAYYDDVKRKSARALVTRRGSVPTIQPSRIRLTPSPNSPSSALPIHIHTYTHSHRAVAAQLKAKFITSAHRIVTEAHTRSVCPYSTSPAPHITPNIRHA